MSIENWVHPERGSGKTAKGDGYKVIIDDSLDVEGAVACLSETMELLGNHPNVEPLAFQGALMSAMTQMGKSSGE